MLDLDTVVELIGRRLDPGGVLVVVEWDWVRFDEATARWCFDRLADDEPGWLHRHRDEWLHSGQSWDTYLDRWARAEGLHTGQDMVQAGGAGRQTRQGRAGTASPNPRPLDVRRATVDPVDA